MMNSANRLLRHSAVVNGHAFRHSGAASQSVTDVAQETDDFGFTRDSSSATSATSAASVSSVTQPKYDPLSIERFRPAKPDCWRKALFKLARHYHGRSDAESAFSEWRQRFQPAASDDTLAEEWLFAKSAVKNPPRIKLVEVLKATEDAGIPKWVSDVIPDASGRIQMALAFLHRLQDQSYPKEDNFFVSTRDLGSLFEASAQWASRTLRLFAQRSIIEVVEPGGRHNWKATRFRFVRGRDGGAE
jgi:hypothetical protein